MQQRENHWNSQEPHHPLGHIAGLLFHVAHLFSYQDHFHEQVVYDEKLKENPIFPYSDIRSVIAWEKLFLGSHLESSDAPLEDTETYTELKPSSEYCALASKEGYTSLCDLLKFCKHLL